MAEYSIRKTTDFGAGKDIRFVDSSASTLTFSGVTVSTSLSANTVSATTYYGSGANLTDIDSQDTLISGYTYQPSANTFTIELTNNSAYTASINVVSGLTTNSYIDFSTQSTPSVISGRTYFDRNENALSYYPETPNNDVTINIGQESVVRVYNGTGQQINNGQACHITSLSPPVNGVPSVILATATGNTGTGSHYEISGVATHDIPNGSVGFITSFGIVRDLTITGVTEGTEIFLSDSEPGGFVYTEPEVDSRRSLIGHVITTGVTTAKIIVDISNEIGYFDLTNSQIAVITQNNSSTGTREGGEMTINAGDNTLLDISSGSGIIVDNFTDPNDPTIDYVTWDAITGITLTSLTGEAATYILIDSNANVVQYPLSSPPTEADKRDNIYIGLVGHASNTFINNVFNTPIQLVSPVNQHEDLTSAIGPFSIAGNRIVNIPGTLQLEKATGVSFFYGGNFHNDIKTPSQINTPLLSGDTLIYAKGDTVIGPSGNTIDPNNYDPDGLGVITNIPGSNNYVAHRIWHQPSQNLLVFQYGQQYYTNLANARDNFEIERFVVPPGLTDVAYLIAVIITQETDTDLDDALIIPQGKFAGTGGGGSSPDTLQSAYDNSTQPEILTDPTRGSVDIRVGSGSDSDNLITFQENAGTINGFVTGLGDAKFNSLSGDSLTLLSTPILNNSGTEILVRNSTTGLVNYRDVSSITPDTNTFVTGYTYNPSNNTFTITRNDSSAFTATIATISGITTTGDILPDTDNTVNLGSPSRRFRQINTVSGTSTFWKSTTVSASTVIVDTIDLGLDSSGNTRIITADSSLIRNDCLNGGNF